MNIEEHHLSFLYRESSEEVEQTPDEENESESEDVSQISQSEVTESQDSSMEDDSLEASIKEEAEPKKRGGSKAVKAACSLCEDGSTYNRSQLLIHLQNKHFAKAIKMMYSYPGDGEPCNLCIMEERSEFYYCKQTSRGTNKEGYFRHVSGTHEKVVDCIPDDPKHDEMIKLIKKKNNFVQIDDTNKSEILNDDQTVEMDNTEPLEDSAAEEQSQDEETSSTINHQSPDTSRVKGPSARVFECTICGKPQPGWRLPEHLSFHFTKQIIEIYGDFEEGANCKVCETQGNVGRKMNKMFIAKNRTAHARHLGATHRFAIDLLGQKGGESKVLADELRAVLTKKTKSMKLKQEQDNDESVADENVPLEMNSSPTLRPKIEILKKKKKSRKGIKQESDESDAYETVPLESFQPSKTIKEEDVKDIAPIHPEDIPISLYKLSSLLTIEKKSEANKSKSYKCGECPSLMESRQELAKHMRIHVGC